MKVRLTRKLAPCVDGIDLNGAEVGDVLTLADYEARLLIAEGWATDRERRRSDAPPVPVERRRRPAPPLDDSATGETPVPV